MPDLFTEKSKASTIVAILYTERLHSDWRNILSQQSYAYVVSPLHAPEGNKKEHRHLLLKNLHGDLSFNKVDSMLELLNPGHVAPEVCGRTNDDCIRLVKYFAHINEPDKEQFDIQKPSAEVVSDD